MIWGGIVTFDPKQPQDSAPLVASGRSTAMKTPNSAASGSHAKRGRRIARMTMQSSMAIAARKVWTGAQEELPYERREVVGRAREQLEERTGGYPGAGQEQDEARDSLAGRLGVVAHRVRGGVLSWTGGGAELGIFSRQPPGMKDLRGSGATVSAFLEGGCHGVPEQGAGPPARIDDRHVPAPAQLAQGRRVEDLAEDFELDGPGGVSGPAGRLVAAPADGDATTAPASVAGYELMTSSVSKLSSPIASAAAGVAKPATNAR